MAMSEEVKEILAKLKKFDIFSTDPKQRQEVNKILEEMLGRVTQSDMDAMREESIRIRSELEARLKRADELEVENAELKARLENAVELKAKAGDTVYMPWVYDGVSDIAKLHICLIIMDSETITYAVDFIADLGDAEKGFMKKYKHGQFTKKDFGKIVFTDYTEAEAKLAVLRGEK